MAKRLQHLRFADENKTPGASFGQSSRSHGGCKWLRRTVFFDVFCCLRMEKTSLCLEGL